MSLADYFRKMRGTTRGSPPRVTNAEIAWSWLGAFMGVATLGWLDHMLFEGQDRTLLVASLGASGVLVFGAPRSPLAQPRNLVGGHVLSALVGVACWKLLHPFPWLAGALAVSTSIAIMHATRTLHPPGGATALIAVIGSKEIHDLGFYFVVMPCLAGALVLLAVAMVVNNVPRSRHYPEIWF